MGMGKSLNTSADKGEQLLLLCAPLGKLLKTHYQGYLPWQTILFQIFCGSRRNPSEDFLLLLSSMRRCQWFLLANPPPPTMFAPTSPSKILCGPGAACAQYRGAIPLLPGAALHCCSQTLEMSYRRPHHSLGSCQGKDLGPAALEESSEAGHSRRRTGGMGEEHRFIGEEASRGSGVFFMIVKSTL